MTLRDQIISFKHTSSILAGNPLGDPHERDLLAYLPPGYESEPDRRYPVIWVLASYGSWGERFFNLQPYDENIVQRMDRLVREGQAQPVILAFPDCFNRYGGSQYINSTAVGAYEDYLIEELIPFLDGELRTLPACEHRGVMGYSSGGYGALMLAMRHPDIFGAAASHSGDMFFDYAYRDDFPAAIRTLANFESVADFIAQFLATREKKGDWHKTLGTIAMSAFYSPNPDNPQGFDFPFDLHTGVIREDVWEHWRACDPVSIAADHIEALRSLKALYLECGIQDEYSLFLGARLLDQILDQHNVPHTYEEFDGGHRHINWRYDVSLPIITMALAPQDS
jgi:enterochelin esterase-like enzyme